MSEMARAARAAMKNKIQRLTAGEPKAKVDASTWSPPEMMNTGAKTGMRPISRRAFRKGGKVIEKCEGVEAMKRADRKQRKTGGRSLVTDLINRNDKKANLARDGGGAHVGGYKRGGDVEQDKKLIKKAISQHDKHMHGGKHEEIKLKKGGRTRKQAGGSMTEREKNAYNRRINDMLEDSRDVRTERLLMPPSAQESDFDKRTRELMPEPKRGSMPPDADMKNPVTGAPRTGRKKGGGTYFGGTRPTGGRMPHARGGSTYASMDDKPRLRLVKTHTGPEGRTAKVYKDADWGEYRVKHYVNGQHQANADYHTDDLEDAHGTAQAMMRDKRARGGRTKGKTNIVILVNAGKPDQQQAMMPKVPTPSPLPVPPIAPLPMPMGAGAPPMPLPPGPPPAGLAGGAPGAMPPLPRKAGGRAYRSYKDMDAGALSGMGRLEKTEIEHGKRIGRLSGGRARSYKDMDAGALSGMGRIEKTAIQKHKR